MYRIGTIEVVCGSMYCGKTEELIRRVRRAIIAKQKVQIFKPIIDDRYGIDSVVSHSGLKVEALPVNSASEILDNLDDSTTVVAIDEAQFFDDEIIEVVKILSARNARVILAGLDTDFRAEPFGPMPVLMSIATEVLKLNAICVVCGEDASRTQRLISGEPADYNDPIILIGAQESYEARCLKHHCVPRKK